MLRVSNVLPAWVTVMILASCGAWGGPEHGDELEDISDRGGAQGVGLGWFFEGLNRVDVETEALIGSDVTVLRTSALYEQQRGKLTVGATLGYTDIDIEYSPRTVTFPADRSESNREAQLDLAWTATPRVEFSGLARIYDGFPDYRAAWIAEYYEQFFGAFSSYHDPDPRGWALGAGLAWTVAPGRTLLTFDFGYGEDDVVQGWSFGLGGLEASAHRREVRSGGLVWEQVLNAWLKSRSSLRLMEISERESRFQVQTDWAAAVSEAWTVRMNAGATRERPDFEAYFAGAVVDYEFLPGWHLSGHARYYEDTGEIESSGFSTAAPGLQSFELGASLLYDHEDFAVRLYGGFYNTDFEPLDPTNVEFGNLYRDRDWWVLRFAVSYSF